jgi:uncharacterized lipoprotein YddW (UPF0748 family)
MKSFIIFLLVFISSNYSIPQTNNQEFRSIWVVTWEYINGGSSPEVNKTRIRTILDNMKAANMTSVLWQIRQAGTAYYNSSYEPYGSYAGGTYPGFDPLQYALDEAHKRGMELHAWFNVFASGSTAQGTPAQQHPEWICRDRDGIPMAQNIALSPGLPAVRNYLVDVAMEVIRNYDVDGFHLDYVRWNEYTNSGFVDKTADETLPDGIITAAQMQDISTNLAGRYLYDVDHPYSSGVPPGYASWENWWRSSVTEFVRVLQDSIKSEKPWVKLSCAALGKYNWSGWNGYNIVYQDAALWFNSGYVDQIAGMHYHWTTGSGFLGMLTNACPECWGMFLQPGIAAGRLYSVGPPSYILHENNIWNNHQDIVNATRTVDWVDGFQFFSYASWRDRNYFNEAANTFFRKKTKVRNSIPSTESITTPQLQIAKIDSLNYRLTIIPPALSKPYWFVLYRSPNNNFSRDTSEIVAVRFDDSIFTVNETFNGLQDFNGSYRYSVTMLNRFWKESELSNIVLTDPIPSYAPVVVSTNPAEGDTVLISAPIEITFSKSMNLSNLNQKLEFLPPVEITNILTEPKKITITTLPREYNLNYTLRIDSLLRDVNGRMLDGNSDGIEGDPFYLNFVSAGPDTIGPAIITTSPALLDSADIESVLSFVFNEPVLSSSVTGNVILYENSLVVPAEVVIYNYSSSAVINVKPAQPFKRNSSYTCVLKKQIKDQYGNEMSEDFNLAFSSRNEGYSVKTVIDDFTNETGWEQPGYSGSTSGILVPPTRFGYSTAVYLPSTSPKKAALLAYKWNPDVTPHLIREYLSGGPAREITFDTSYTIQVYVHGDGSGSLLRFAIDESVGGAWPNHEVSKWIKINWIGWKLVEWDLGDPSLVGTWIGNEILDGTAYRIDSFQLTDTAGSASEGLIYFDNFRVVKKTYSVTSLAENNSVPDVFRLYQNYPNPFNPETVISFDVDIAGQVSLEVFDILGRKIRTLISDELSPGNYKINFDASDLSSGQYVYRIISEGRQQSRLMMLLK